MYRRAHDRSILGKIRTLPGERVERVLYPLGTSVSSVRYRAGQIAWHP